MTQDEKDLLIKDLCARLPYGVKVLCLRDFNHTCYNLEMIDIGDNEVYLTTNEPDINRYSEIEAVKPYLFPMSSMTEEQKEEFNARTIEIMFGETVCKKNDEMGYGKLMAFDLDFYNKHHLDWRGLIPMGLAIDATNLNIY